VIRSIALLSFLFLTGILWAQQSPVISEKFNQVPLSEVLKKLRTKYNLKIAYDAERVRGVIITQELKDVPLEEAFTKILGGTSMTYQLINNKVVIVPKNVDEPVRHKSNQNIFISGVIMDQETGETLPNAFIHIAGTNAATISNADGFFTLLDIPFDTSSLLINYLGYATKRIKLNPQIATKNIQISLEASVSQLDEVTIADAYEAPLKVNEQISKVAFNPKSLSSLPSLGEQDLFRTLQLLPGVSGTNESSSGMVVRGSNPSQNLILLDGFTIYHLDHFFGVFSAFNSDIIKDVQIYKGGYDARYGGRVSGVVDITGKTGNSTKPAFTIGANLVSIRGSMEFPIGKKMSFLFAGRRAFTDIIQSNLYQKLFDISQKNDEQLKRPLDDPLFEKVKPDFYFYDVHSKLTYKPSKKDIVSLSLYGGKDNLMGERSNSQVSITPPASFSDNLVETTRWGNNGLSLRWGRQWNERYYSNVIISGSDFFRDYGFKYMYELDTTGTNISQSFSLNQDNTIRDSNLMIENEWQVSKNIHLDFGLAGIEHNILYNTTANEQVVDEREDVGNITSLYTTAKFLVGNRLNISIGTRLNYHEINDTSYIEPRLNLSYKINDKLNIKAAYGKHYQFVNQVQYDDPYNGIQNFWAFSNIKGIPIVSAHHFIIGGSYRIGTFLFDVEAYYKDLEGVTEFNPIPFFVQDQLLDLGLFVNGKGRMRGIDLLLEKESGKHKGWLGYSWSRSLNSFPTVDQGKYYPSPYDQTHELKAVYLLTLDKWNLSANWIYGTGRPYPEFDVLYFRDANGAVEDFVVVKDRANFQRLPDYHRMDIAGAYTFRSGKFSGEAGLSIFNVYARDNVKNRKLNISSLQTTLGSTELVLPTPTYRDLVLIGFTPSVFVTVSF